MSGTVFPIVGIAAGVGDGQNLHRRTLLAIDDEVGKFVEQKPASLIRTLRPSLRGL